MADIDLNNVKKKVQEGISKFGVSILVESRVRLFDVGYGFDTDNNPDKSHAIVTFCLGLNGNGELKKYLDAVQMIVAILETIKFHVWLVDWKNDCPDDVSTLRLGVSFKEEE